MFAGAILANPDVSGWNISKVVNMTAMFFNAVSAKPNTTNWQPTSLTNMTDMFKGATAATPELSNINFANVAFMDGIFSGIALPANIYSNLLRQIAKTTTRNNVILDADKSHYQAIANDARASLIEHGWKINDAGPI